MANCPRGDLGVLLLAGLRPSDRTELSMRSHRVTPSRSVPRITVPPSMAQPGSDSVLLTDSAAVAGDLHSPGCPTAWTRTRRSSPPSDCSGPLDPPDQLEARGLPWRWRRSKPGEGARCATSLHRTRARGAGALVFAVAPVPPLQARSGRRRHHRWSTARRLPTPVSIRGPRCTDPRWPQGGARRATTITPRGAVHGRCAHVSVRLAPRRAPTKGRRAAQASPGLRGPSPL